MRAIGGFFELELPDGKSLYHDEAIKLSTGRACLGLILKTNTFSKIYLPYYCCDALFEPLDLQGVPFEFYAIDKNLEINDTIKLNPNEAIVYCNFFGIKSNYVNELIKRYGNQLIIDNSHSFFSKGFSNNISFTTARKYFGVPDGAFLYAPKEVPSSGIERNNDVYLNHNVNRLLGNQEKAYREFLSYEASLNCDIRQISSVSESLLKLVDYKEVRKIRNENFNFYKNEFAHLNKIEIGDDEKDCFCYPLLLNEKIDVQKLFNQNIFIPSYWNDVVQRVSAKDYAFEIALSKDLLPLPIDHRYTEIDLRRVVVAIKQLI
ncbi:hypothetical protein H7U19_04995 [Hyunsoonleella sp. SJ7]|uniref:DegT/DnrJ/EryC1/StrS aminotransferase family protein n=1 Tax=Hyunsoonleella aquatilis TaxID=2762758 RepID=A0A923KI18_9FLAO|nr:hypothetical protein [Hyunsoonleella aquatilis]MBC3757749.1 hypothetical protein [Hyunsoonleella aquatilis]